MSDKTITAAEVEQAAGEAKGFKVGDRVRCDAGHRGTVETTARDAVYWTDDDGYARFSRERHLTRISEHVVEPSPPPASPVQTSEGGLRTSVLVAALMEAAGCDDLSFGVRVGLERVANNLGGKP